MADHNFNINISGGGSVGSGSPDPSLNFMQNVLNRLTAAIDRLNQNIDKFARINDDQQRQPSGSGPKDPVRELGDIITKGIAAALSTTLFRLINNETQAIMGRAGASGSFMAATIQGNANNQFGNYVGQLWNVERTRQLSYNSIMGQGIGAAAGIAASAIPFGGLLAGVAGAGLGGIMGSYGTAALANSPLEQRYRIMQAISQRSAEASVSEWQTGFSRFGLRRSPYEIVPAGLTANGRPLIANLSTEFQNQYGGSQNYNSILNNIVPYLQNGNILDRTKNGPGNLDLVSQNFMKAGFSAAEFARLTIQGSQYQLLTGKNLQAFSEDIKQARSNFGNAYDINTNQTALNLMAAGYQHDQSQSIAFQSMFNPQIAQGIGRYNQMGITEFFRNRALGNATGINLNETMRTGRFVGDPSAGNRLMQELNEFQEGQGYGPTLAMLQAGGGFDPAFLRGILRTRNPQRTGVNEDAGLSPAQSAGESLLSQYGGMANVDKMTVNANTVNLVPQMNSSFGALANRALENLGPIGSLVGLAADWTDKHILHPPSSISSESTPALGK